MTLYVIARLKSAHQWGIGQVIESVHDRHMISSGGGVKRSFYSSGSLHYQYHYNIYSIKIFLEFEWSRKCKK